jgi:general secretion pathway protein A
MFLDFYGLNLQPFGVTPNSGYLYPSRSHREALASLYYGIESDRGFMALIARPGMGKTTLIFHLLEKLRPGARTAFLFQTQCSPDEFLRFLFSDLGCDARNNDPVALRAELNEILLTEAKAGRRVVLFIDEAQNLSNSVLETIRLLTNFETPEHKLFQIVLSGQPELAERLALPELVQLRQRISIVTRISPLNTAEIPEYINHRLKVAGYCGDLLFAAGAMELIASHSEGIPRTINNLCFNSLSLGCARRKKVIDDSIVREVISDLSLGDSPGTPAPASWGRSNLRLAASISLILGAGSLSFMFSPAPRQMAAVPKITLQAPSADRAPEVNPSPLRVGKNPAGLAGEMKVPIARDDNLRRITQRYLGRNLDKNLRDQILRLNPQIANPDFIRTGDQIRLPLLADDEKRDRLVLPVRAPIDEQE